MKITFKADTATVIMRAGNLKSKREAIRLIKAGAVYLDGVKITNPLALFTCNVGSIIQIGKRTFIKVCNPKDREA